MSHLTKILEICLKQSSKQIFTSSRDAAYDIDSDGNIYSILYGPDRCDDSSR